MGKNNKMKNLYKYPRTKHFPWSKGITSDDKILKDLSSFEGKEIVVLEKYDGENCNLYNNYIHARSLDSKNHVSRNWVKKFHSEIKHNIPKDFRICGENLFAKHSIYYENLPSFFLCFSIWDKNICLNWDDTIEYADMLGLDLVNTLYRGIFDVEKIREIENTMDFDKQEGYVVRNTDSFLYDDFSKNVGKYVRENHIKTDEHWMFCSIVENKLA